MDGILNVFKPGGITSFDVIRQLRKILHIKKIGHAGTLDPMATGVLPVFLGKATKAIEYTINKDKKYRVELTIGFETDTQDSSGNIIAESDENFSKEELIKSINKFKGRISQIPPMYSAIKQQGKKLYELARQGITVERKPREIEIYSINIINIKENRVLFDVECSKGTYVRTLCSDIAKDMGKCGHMSLLTRVMAGDFHINNSITLEDISKLILSGELEKNLIKIDYIFKQYDKVVLDNICKRFFVNGSFINLEVKQNLYNEILRVYDNNETFIGIGEFIQRGEEMLFKAKKLF